MLKKRFFIVFLVFTLIVGLVPSKKVNAYVPVLEVVAAYKLLEGLLFTMFTVYTVKTVIEYDSETGILEIPDSRDSNIYVGSNFDSVLRAQEILNNARNGWEPQPEPEHDFLFPPMSREFVKNAWNVKTDDEAVALANEIYQEMEEEEKQKFNDDLDYKINIARKYLSRVEPVILPLINKLVNPDVYIDYTTLPIYSNGSPSVSLGSVDFLRHEIRYSSTNKFVNLCVNNGVEDIVMFTLNYDSQEGGFIKLDDKLYPYPSFFKVNDSCVLVGFFDGSYSVENDIYLGTDHPGIPARKNYVRKINFDSEALIVGQLIGSSFDVISDDKMYLRTATGLDGEVFPNCITVTNFTIPDDLGLPSDIPISIPNLEGMNLTVPSDIPQENEENFIPYWERIFSDFGNLYDLIVGESLGEYEEEEEKEKDFDFELPSVFDVNLVGIDGVDENNRLDFSPLTNALSEISEKFPFSLPWDLMRLISMLNADPIAPKFEMDLSEHENPIYNGIVLTIDLAEFEEIIVIIRFFMMMIFIYVLIINTKLTRH